MRVPRRLTGRGVLCALSSAVLVAVLPPASAVPAPKEAPRVPFEERYRATLRGGIVRAANSATVCGKPASSAAVPCQAAHRVTGGNNGHYEMTYADVDEDPRTYNSTRSWLDLPGDSRVTYARLYWGGNLRVGEQKPPKDNGRVLIAEPGGSYREVRADSRIGHRRTGDPRTTGGYDGYTASADVTSLVARSGGGFYTVAQINVAKGRTPAGAWGGWTLVVAYAHDDAPLRNLLIMDGYEHVTASRRSLTVKAGGLRIPPRASGSVGVVAYDGDRGPGGDALTVRAGKAKAVRVRDAANPADDLMNSTIADHGRPGPVREPSHQNTLGYDSDVLDIHRALARGGRTLTFRFTTGGDAYHLGALFVQTEARR